GKTLFEARRVRGTRTTILAACPSPGLPQKLWQLSQAVSECPLLAQSGHDDSTRRCLLLGVKRTWAALKRLLLTQSGHQRCCVPSHLASQIQQCTPSANAIKTPIAT